MLWLSNAKNWISIVIYHGLCLFYVQWFELRVGWFFLLIFGRIVGLHFYLSQSINNLCSRSRFGMGLSYILVKLQRLVFQMNLVFYFKAIIFQKNIWKKLIRINGYLRYSHLCLSTTDGFFFAFCLLFSYFVINPLIWFTKS